MDNNSIYGTPIINSNTPEYIFWLGKWYRRDSPNAEWVICEEGMDG